VGVLVHRRVRRTRPAAVDALRARDERCALRGWKCRPTERLEHRPPTVHPFGALHGGTVPPGPGRHAGGDGERHGGNPPPSHRLTARRPAHVDRRLEGRRDDSGAGEGLHARRGLSSRPDTPLSQARDNGTGKIRPEHAAGHARGQQSRDQLRKQGDGVEPKGSGTSLRRMFLQGRGLNSSYAIFQDATGKAFDRVVALGIAIGSGYLFETNFKKEVYSDLTGERGTLMGCIQGIFAAQYQVLRERGHSPSEAFNETVEELTQSLMPLVAENGIDRKSVVEGKSVDCGGSRI